MAPAVHRLRQRQAAPGRPLGLQRDHLQDAQAGHHGIRLGHRDQDGRARRAADHQALAFGGPMWVSPTTTKPTVGTIQSFTFAQLVSPPKAKGTPYALRARLRRASRADPSAALHRRRTASLATVHERYYLNARRPGSGRPAAGSSTSSKLEILFAFNEFSMPGLQTQYLSGGPESSGRATPSPSPGQAKLDSLHTVTAGKQLTDNWDAYPLHPQPNVQLLTGRNARIFSCVPVRVALGRRNVPVRQSVWRQPAQVTRARLIQLPSQA